jgi:hypothetical protein
MEYLTNGELDELELLSRKGTKDWFYQHCPECREPHHLFHRHEDGYTNVMACNAANDLRLAAAARNALPKLIAANRELIECSKEVKQLTAALARLEEAILAAPLRG